MQRGHDLWDIGLRFLPDVEDVEDSQPGMDDLCALAGHG
jgi:hypothetical protein